MIDNLSLFVRLEVFINMIDLCTVTAGEIRKALFNYKAHHGDKFGNNTLTVKDKNLIDKISNIISVIGEHHKFNRNYRIYKQLYKIIEDNSSSPVCRSIFKTDSDAHNITTETYIIDNLMDNSGSNKKLKKLTMEDLFY